MKRSIWILSLFITQAVWAVTLSDIFHNPKSIFYVNPAFREIKLRAKKNSLTQAFSVTPDGAFPMKKVYIGNNYDYYRVNLDSFPSTLSYYFLITDGNDTLRYPTAGDLTALVTAFDLPTWSKGKIYYSIFPDGFFNGKAYNDPIKKRAWQDPPKNWIPYGGDLAGIIQKMEYIDSLDIDIILIQPIFTAPSNHKLNPQDYSKLDPNLGDTLELQALITEAHRRNLKIILHVPFTQTSINFPIFEDISKNGVNSNYTDWYHINNYPLDFSPPNYRCWRQDYRFPALNLANPQIKNFLIGYLEFWKHFGFDGFYIGEISDIDAGFARSLRKHLKTKYPDILLISSDKRLISGDGFDGCYNKTLANTIIDYFLKGTVSASEFDHEIQKWLFFSPPQAHSVNLLPLSTYNMRINQSKYRSNLKNLYAFIFTFVGSPVILYGDEIGMSEYSPLNPGSFPWDIAEQNRTLLAEIKKLIEIRKKYHQFTGQKFYSLYANDITKVYAYDRGGIIVVLNSGNSESYVELPAWDGPYLDIVSGEKRNAFSQLLRISIPPKSYTILKREF